MAEISFPEANTLFSRYSIKLSKEQYDLFSQFAELLTTEKSRQNVTAVTDFREIWVRHFLDSAYILRFLPQSGRLIDIGTGGGIPGIPLAIMNPNLQITLLDSELQKIEFCRRVINSLGLSCTAISGRAEELARTPEFRESFDIAISRAMAAASMLSELSIPFLRVGGTLFAMKGRNFDPNTESFATAAEKLGCELPENTPYTIENEPKTLITVRKIASTPTQYPRRFAKIKRDPL